MSSTRLFLLRHGEVESRYQRRFGGRIDMELSPLGHAQAAALAKYFESRQLDAIYCSPMKRAQQTLAPLIQHYKIQPTTIRDFCEVHFGDWTGLSWQELHDKYQISAFQWLEMLDKAAVPNGECSQTFRTRIEPGLKQILENHSGQNVAVMCHGGVIRMMLSILLDLPLSKLAGFEIDYASLTQVDYIPNKTEVQLLNFTPGRDLA
jgi:broad specificity phosphatase PhoE